MKPSMNAVIVAGGKSSRMGQDKSLLPFGGYPTLTEYQYTRLSSLFNYVYISAKKNKFDFECQVITDTIEESSPLVGLVSIFETLDVEEVFILSVDAPLVDESVIKKLLDHPKDSCDVTVAKSPSGIQPLCGIYKRSVMPLAYHQLAKGNHRLGDLLHLAKTCFVTFEEDAPFTNLNHPEEYQEAIRIFENFSE